MQVIALPNLSYSPCAGSRDKQIFLWDPEAAVPVRKLLGHDWQVTDVAIAEDGTIYSSSLDGCAAALSSMPVLGDGWLSYFWLWLGRSVFSTAVMLAGKRLPFLLLPCVAGADQTRILFVAAGLSGYGKENCATQVLEGPSGPCAMPAVAARWTPAVWRKRWNSTSLGLRESAADLWWAHRHSQVPTTVRIMGAAPTAAWLSIVHPSSSVHSPLQCIGCLLVMVACCLRVLCLLRGLAFP